MAHGPRCLAIRLPPADPLRAPRSDPGACGHLPTERAVGTLIAVPISTELLDGDEDVLVDLRPHWVVFFGPLVLTAVAVAVVVLIAQQFPKAPVALAWLLAALVAVPAAWFAGRLARWFGTSLVVTDRRIVMRSGVLGRRIVNIRLQRVVDTHCTQRPLERLIGSGTLVFEVEGEEGGLALDDVRRPRALQGVINRQLGEIDAGWRERQGWSRAPSRVVDRRDRLESTDWTPPNGVPSVRRGHEEASVPDQLVALDRLRRQGIVSEQEFAEKKAELLRRF